MTSIQHAYGVELDDVASVRQAQREYLAREAPGSGPSGVSTLSAGMLPEQQLWNRAEEHPLNKVVQPNGEIDGPQRICISVVQLELRSMASRTIEIHHPKFLPSPAQYMGM